jgi:hypothetical protein
MKVGLTQNTVRLDVASSRARAIVDGPRLTANLLLVSFMFFILSWIMLRPQ